MAPLTAIPVERLVPHARPMLLLDALIASDGPCGSAVATIRPGNPFLKGEAVPALVGLEYLAQTVAAHGGYQARQHGTPVRGGFLLGTPQLTLHTDEFPIGIRLRMDVEAVFEDEELLRFSGKIFDLENERLLVEGQLTIYQPANIAAFLAEARSKPGAPG